MNPRLPENFCKRKFSGDFRERQHIGKRRSLEAELKEQEELLENAGGFLEVVGRYLEVQERKPEVLHEFVGRVVVHGRLRRRK